MARCVSRNGCRNKESFAGVRDIAKKMADKMNKKTMSAQAVGGAVGLNPVSIIIPCHRVVGAGGSLTGYSGGIEKKIWLLTHEGKSMKQFTIPKKGNCTLSCRGTSGRIV